MNTIIIVIGLIALENELAAINGCIAGKSNFIASTKVRLLSTTGPFSIIQDYLVWYMIQTSKNNMTHMQVVPNLLHNPTHY